MAEGRAATARRVGTACPLLKRFLRALSLLLEKHDGNIAGVARELGKPRSQIYRWLRTLGLPRAVR